MIGMFGVHTMACYTHNCLHIYWSGVIFQDQHFLGDIMMYEEAHYRLTAFVSCWNRDRQMWYAWCPELLHPELCYTRTSNQRYVFI